MKLPLIITGFFLASVIGKHFDYKIVKYSKTQVKQTARDCPNLFVKSGVRDNREINSLNQAEPNK
jgi:hypothetical protein